MVFSVLLAAILDFNINCVIEAQVFKHESPQNKKGYFEHESQVCESAVHPDMVYNHDNGDFICYFGGHFICKFWKEKRILELGMGQIWNQHIRIV